MGKHIETALRFRRGFKTTIMQLVIGFGFLNGVWFAIGMDPQKIVIKFLIKIVETYFKLPSWLIGLLVFVPIILVLITLFTIFKAYHKGGVAGIIAVILAFISGALVFTSLIASAILIFFAIVLGFIVFGKRR